MILNPLFPTPLTDLFAILTPNYRLTLKNHYCSKITMRFYNCLEAYGSERGQTKCKDLFYDMFECYNQKVQTARVEEIKKERKRKYKAGEIDEAFSEKPPMESYFHL